MTKRQPWLSMFATAWAVVATVTVLTVVRTVNPDARILVGLVGATAAACAAGAARLLALDVRRRRAGLLLVASAAAPTVFAWALNAVALLVGVFLLLDGPTLAWARVRPPRRQP